MEPSQCAETTNLDFELTYFEQDILVAAECSRLWGTGRLIELRLGAALLFVQLANRTKAARRSRGFVVGIGCLLARNEAEYLTTAGSSSVFGVGGSAEMPLVVGNELDSGVVVDSGVNNTARLRSTYRLGVALNHFAQV